jgi:hypothetical protein
MRGAPLQAKRQVFLNQADTSERRAMANAVVDALAAVTGLLALDVAVGQLKPSVDVHSVHHLDDRGESGAER